MGCCFGKERDYNAAGLNATGMSAKGEASAAAEFITGGGLTSRVELSISARGLKDKDVMSKSDPFCVVYIRAASGTWNEIGRTEIIANNLNPTFMTRPHINYNFEEVQHVRFELYDCASSFTTNDATKLRVSDQNFLGSSEGILAKIINCQGASWTSPIVAKSGIQRGNLYVQAEELSNCNGLVQMVLRCSNVEKAGLIGTAHQNPFLRFSKLREDGTYSPCFKTEVKKNNSDPVFQEIKASIIQLTNGDMYRPLRVELVDWNKDGDHVVLGIADCSLHKLSELARAGGAVSIPFVNPAKAGKPGYINSGNLHCPTFQFVPQPSFIDYVKGGLKISFIVAIDYTASNGDPVAMNSLHYVDPTGRTLNQYAQAIRGIGNVIEFYDADKRFPLYGFGGKPVRGGPPSHCFAINGVETAPEVDGVNGILQTYYKSLRTVQLSGPTLFANIVNQAAAIASYAPQSQAQSHYHVLLILTDGMINDMENTVDAIVNASSLPLSVLIVGVGQSDELSDMHRLDGDKQRLTSRNGRQAVRDIVQFTAMKEFRSFAGQNYEEALAKSLLEEIPLQVVEYFKQIGIKPNPPATMSPIPSAPPQMDQSMPPQVPQQTLLHAESEFAPPPAYS